MSVDKYLNYNPPSQILTSIRKKVCGMNKYNVFEIQLTKQQKQFISRLLPMRVSLQSVSNENHKAVGRPTNKHKSPQKSEDGIVGRESSDQKRRRNRNGDEHHQLEQKNMLGKRQQINRCWQILRKLKKHNSAWPFKSPVNTKQLSVPDYFKIVLNPIDLQTIQNNFKHDVYEHVSQFQRDINQMFLNSYKFNPKNSTYFTCTTQLEEYYNQLLKQSTVDQEKKKLPDRNKKKEENNQRHIEGEKTSELVEVQRQIALLLKKSTQYALHKHEKPKVYNYNTRVEAPMNIQQKRQIGYEIRKLAPNHIERVGEIIYKGKTKGQNRLEEGTFGVDLDKLDLKTLRQVQNYIKQTNKKIEEEPKQQYESKELPIQQE